MARINGSDREDFQSRLSDLLKAIFEELRDSSDILAQKCILPTQDMTITIKPVGDLAFDEIPSVEVSYTFLPSMEAVNKFFSKEEDNVEN